jgi:hypothetical protein
MFFETSFVDEIQSVTLKCHPAACIEQRAEESQAAAYRKRTLCAR